MTEELIKRLRYDCELALQLGGEARVVLPANDVRTIADRIEALAAENERLREAGRGMMEALEQARAVLDEHFGALPTEYPMPEIKAALAAARTTLGETQ